MCGMLDRGRRWSWWTTWLNPELPGGATEDGHVVRELLDACGLPAKGLRVPCGVEDFHFLPDAEAVRLRVARGGRGPPDGGKREV
ncbi:Hypothetical protein FKW44_012070 [Caligus rogercresseyi]|uniref:Uncharacterized protein n=1 Tax=Caligus rogercresseyi TaxID=217165 RepID=A0A7T8HIW0_CALRO|nr:Hypothetical protein FKW44_012070 [Caligus rogercresseyi]